ncbi:hypothetical protein ACT4UL_01525, partial [Bacillus sp. HC-TM]
MARSECEVDGASDLEALFASREEAKPPNILATVAGFHQKAKVARSQATKKKENGLAFHQSEAILFLLTLFLFLLESWYVFEECFFLLA